MQVKHVNIRAIDRLKYHSGFSLVEILVTVMIFSFLAAAVNTVLLVGDATWQTNSVQVQLQQELRKAMDWMKDDIRQTGSAAITNVPADGTWYPTIIFRPVIGVSSGVIDWGDADATTQFVLGGTDSNQLQKITRDDDGDIASTDILAQNIQTLQFRRLNATSDLVEVSMQAQKGTFDGAKGNTVTDTLDFKVQLRN